MFIETIALQIATMKHECKENSSIEFKTYTNKWKHVQTFSCQAMQFLLQKNPLVHDTLNSSRKAWRNVKILKTKTVPLNALKWVLNKK